MNKVYEKPVAELIVFQSQESVMFDGGWDGGFETSDGWGVMPVDLE